VKKTTIARIVLISLATLAFASFGALATAQPPTAPADYGWLLVTVDNLNDVGQYNSLALDPAIGDPRISYSPVALPSAWLWRGRDRCGWCGQRMAGD